jgi:hypothetical protein
VVKHTFIVVEGFYSRKKRILMDKCTLQANINALQNPYKTDFQSTKAQAGGRREKYS